MRRADTPAADVQRRGDDTVNAKRLDRVNSADEVGDTAQAAADLAFGGDLAVAVLLSQKMIGRKVWVK